jgi:hypothetical protein
MFEAERVENQRAQQDAAHQSELAHRAFLAEQARILPSVSPELADPEKGQERRVKTFEYLQKAGFDDATLKYVSAHELRISYNSMLYEEGQEQAKQVSSLPRKAAAAPKTVRPSGQSAVSPQRALQGLETKLTQVGKSGRLNDAYDAAASVMAARREQASRKGSRQ